MPHLPGMPPTPTSNNSGAHWAHIIHLLAGYVYSHTSLPWAEFPNLDASAQGSQHDTDFDLNTLTDKRSSTG
jgi:hypothetical protein